MLYYIYKTINLINRKYYIGMHIGKLDDTYLGSGKILKQAINKYGKQNFKKEILVVCENEEELRIWEKKLVDLYVKNPDCYNIAPGGEGGNTVKYFTEEEKEKIKKKASEAIKEWNKQNPEKVKLRQEKQKKTLLSNLDTLSGNIKKALAAKTKEEKQEQHRKVTEAKLKAKLYSIFQLINKHGDIVMESIGAESIARRYKVSANGIRLAANHRNPIKRGNLAGHTVVIKQTST